MKTLALLVVCQTTFFITIDSLLFSLASSTRSADLRSWSARAQVINACLGGAIIFHVCACESPLTCCCPEDWHCVARHTSGRIYGFFTVISALHTTFSPHFHSFNAHT